MTDWRCNGLVCHCAAADAGRAGDPAQDCESAGSGPAGRLLVLGVLHGLYTDTACALGVLGILHALYTPGAAGGTCSEHTPMLWFWGYTRSGRACVSQPYRFVTQRPLIRPRLKPRSSITRSMTQQRRRLLLTRSPRPAPRATTKTDVGCHRGHGSHGTSLSSGLVNGQILQILARMQWQRSWARASGCLWGAWRKTLARCTSESGRGPEFKASFNLPGWSSGFSLCWIGDRGRARGTTPASESAVW